MFSFGRKRASKQERGRERGRERERERERERRRIPSRLCAVSVEPNEGLDLTNCEIVTSAEIKSWTLNQLSHPGTPILNKKKIF